MWIHELKLWLLTALIPALCYFSQAAQTQAETYHTNLTAYIKNDAPSQLMNQAAQTLGIGDSSDFSPRLNDLTIYYLLHPNNY